MSERHNDVTFIMEGNLERKVHAIKQIRGATGMGLRESKEFIEKVELEGSGQLLIRGDYTLQELRANLAECNIGVHNENLMKYAEQLREIASFATLAGDYYVARTLITLLDERF